jgi:serine/threonine-protein kinase HipA
MAGERRQVEVLADWEGLAGPTPMGQLDAASVRGKEILSFEFLPSWLASGHARVIDPALRLVRGPQYPGQDRAAPGAAQGASFGAFLDASPDRWGRVLLQRREAWRAREQGRKERHLSELDYLLGVFDGHRLGALRFRLAGGPFLDDDRELASPPWTSLRELERASASARGTTRSSRAASTGRPAAGGCTSPRL